MKPKIVLGIDPGFDRLGIAVVKNIGNKTELIFSDCITTDKKSTLQKRLLEIYKKVSEIIETYQPERIGMESLFFTKNQKTGIDVAKALGVIYLLAAKKNLNILELTPMQVKTGITGSGRADKKQVEFMVRKIVKITENKKTVDDEFDAIAIAIVASSFNTNL